MKRVLVVNNKDSFVYNLVEYLRHLVGDALDVCDVDCLYTGEWTSENLMSYSHILLSPGAGIPSEYPQMMQFLAEVIQNVDEGGVIPSVLGVCLGHQAIAESLGAKLVQMKAPKHGHASRLQIVRSSFVLWDGVENRSEIARYHSWVVDEATLPESLIIEAYDECQNIMAISHKDYPIYGLQFHPESIITKHGIVMLESWIQKELP